MKTLSKAIVLTMMTSLAATPVVTMAAPANQVTEQKATQQLVRLLAGMNTMTASFSQKTMTAVKTAKQQKSLNSNMNQSFTGEMKVERPGKFYWQTQSPAQQTIVSSGSTVWVYDPDLKQAIRQKLDAQIANTPALLLSGNTTKIMQTYRVTQPDASKMYYVLYPKNKEGVFQSLALSFAANKAPAQMLLKDNMGQTTHIVFSNVKLNTQLPASIFNFTPPKGTEIIDQ